MADAARLAAGDGIVDRDDHPRLRGISVLESCFIRIHDIARFEIAVQFFSRAPIPETEAHFSFCDHVDFNPWRHPRRHGADPGHLGHDRL